MGTLMGLGLQKVLCVEYQTSELLTHVILLSLHGCKDMGGYAGPQWPGSD